LSAPTDDLGPAAVLASPVRRRLLDTLAHATATSHDLTTPVGLTAAELAEHVGLHLTTVRFHLDQLVAAGLVEASFHRSGSAGRPRKIYAPVQGSLAEVDVAGEADALRLLSSLLAGAFADSSGGATPTPLEAGRRWAVEHVPADPASTPARTPGQWLSKVGRMLDVLHEWGYTPEMSTSGDKRFYRDRWSHDKVVRSTHGVNCTGSCSWKVYVKDGIITWEAQQTDYPSTGPTAPSTSPAAARAARPSPGTPTPRPACATRTCAACCSRCTARPRRLGRRPRARLGSIVQDPTRRRRYKSARGKGGLVRASWDEVVEIIAAAHVYTVKRWGPDRIAGFSPIPAMSPVSYASGARFLELIGAPMLSFYDWYADLPNASPQMFGDQTDVPESGDWWDAGYLIMWGSNVPMTRTPDAHWMTEARYRGQKVVAVSPTTPRTSSSPTSGCPCGTPAPTARWRWRWGTSSSRSSSSTSQVDFFVDYNKQYTDLPFLVTLSPTLPRAATAGYRPGKFLVAGDLDIAEAASENAMWKPAVLDAAHRRRRIPNGSIGFRYGDEGWGKWNLDLGDIDPALTLLRPPHGTETVEVVLLPRFDAPDGKVARVTPRRAGAPHRRAPGDHRLRPDARPVRRRPRRPAGQWPTTTTPPQPYTPAWQEEITGVPAEQVTRWRASGRRTPIDTGGRGMILMGAGTNHWFHSDQIYRAMLVLTTITGCQGRNGGGWAHYVGQEKIRPIMGFQHMAFALDWQRPPRHMNQTAYWYVNTSQYRYDTFTADDAGRRRHRRLRGQGRDGPARPVGAPGLDAELPDLQPQPPRAGRRGGCAGWSPRTTSSSS
jgi:nitrate reductase alpha subunit